MSMMPPGPPGPPRPPRPTGPKNSCIWEWKNVPTGQTTQTPQWVLIRNNCKPGSIPVPPNNVTDALGTQYEKDCSP